MASTIFDLPHPFGPTIPVTPLLKFMIVLSPKLLNPLISSLIISTIIIYRINIVAEFAGADYSFTHKKTFVI